MYNNQYPGFPPYGYPPQSGVVYVPVPAPPTAPPPPSPDDCKKSYLKKAMEEWQDWENFKNFQDKINKKEEKKPEKKSDWIRERFSVLEVMMILCIFSPFVGKAVTSIITKWNLFTP